MAWVKVVPANTGGGRKAVTLTASLNDSGQFSMSHAVAQMLGEPKRVLVEIDLEETRIRIFPTTPEAKGAFALSGGGNASYRFSLREVAAKHPKFVGAYTPTKIAGGVLFVKKSRSS